MFLFISHPLDETLSDFIAYRNHFSIVYIALLNFSSFYILIGVHVFIFKDEINWKSSKLKLKWQAKCPTVNHTYWEF